MQNRVDLHHLPIVSIANALQGRGKMSVHTSQQRVVSELSTTDAQRRNSKGSGKKRKEKKRKEKKRKEKKRKEKKRKEKKRKEKKRKEKKRKEKKRKDDAARRSIQRSLR